MESGTIMAWLSTYKKRTKEIEFAIFLALGSFKVLEAKENTTSGFQRVVG